APPGEAAGQDRWHGLKPRPVARRSVILAGPQETLADGRRHSRAVPGQPAGIPARGPVGRARRAGGGRVGPSAATAASTPGTSNSPIDRTPTRAAAVSSTAPVISMGTGHNRQAARANKRAEIPSIARYHQAGELPWALMTNR